MYLPLDLPHVDEVLPQLRAEQVPPAEQSEPPGRGAPSPVGEQAGAAEQVEHGAVPHLRARVAAHDHLQRGRHDASSTTTRSSMREPGVHFRIRQHGALWEM